MVSSVSFCTPEDLRTIKEDTAVGLSITALVATALGIIIAARLHMWTSTTSHLFCVAGVCFVAALTCHCSIKKEKAKPSNRSNRNQPIPDSPPPKSLIPAEQREKLNSIVKRGVLQENGRVTKRTNFLKTTLNYETILLLPETPDPIFSNGTFSEIVFHLSTKDFGCCMLVSKKWYNFFSRHELVRFSRICSLLDQNDLKVWFARGENDLIVHDLLNRNVSIWNVAENRATHSLELHDLPAPTATFFSKKKSCLGISYYEQGGRTVVLYDKELKVIKHHNFAGSVLVSCDQLLGEIYVLHNKLPPHFTLENMHTDASVDFRLDEHTPSSFIVADERIILATKQGSIFIFDKNINETMHFQALKNPDDIVTYMHVYKDYLLCFSSYGIVTKWKLSANAARLLSQETQEPGTVHIVFQKEETLFGVIKAKSGEDIFRGWRF